MHITDKETLRNYIERGYTLIGSTYGQWLLYDTDLYVFATVDSTIAKSFIQERNNAELSDT